MLQFRKKNKDNESAESSYVAHLNKNQILFYIWISAIKFVIRSIEWGGSIGVLAFDARRDAEVIRGMLTAIFMMVSINLTIF